MNDYMKDAVSIGEFMDLLKFGDTLRTTICFRYCKHDQLASFLLFSDVVLCKWRLYKKGQVYIDELTAATFAACNPDRTKLIFKRLHD